MNETIIISSISALGIGGFIGAYIKHKLDRLREIDLKLNQINEEKYRVLLIYMSFVLDPKNRDHFIMKDDILQSLMEKEVSDYANHKIKEYFYHGILYASDDVLHALKEFIEKPDRNNFLKTAKAMRMALWNKKTKLSAMDMILK